MFAKTFCKPGRHICIVPAGLVATLQYDARGILQKVIRGFDETGDDISDQVLGACSSIPSVPPVISITGGTTWVKGVFHIDAVYEASGVLPMCIEQPLIEDMIRHPERCTFYAGDAKSLATHFNGFLGTQNWIKMHRFQVLPTLLVPANFNELTLQHALEGTPFSYPLLSGFITYDGPESAYCRLNFRQNVVKSVSTTIDESGYHSIRVTYQDKQVNHYHLSAKFKYNISKDCVLISEPDGTLVWSNRSPIADRHIKCATCGNSFECPTEGPVKCTDPDCLSISYPRFVQFATALHLPQLSYSQYQSYVKAKLLTCCSDILTLTEYSELSIETTLFNFLQAVIPSDICNNAAILQKVANVCRGDADTFKYYLNNPNRLLIECPATDVITGRLLSWLASPSNISTLHAFIDSPQVVIKKSLKKFEGAPIFRGTTIAITGKFRRGSLSEIESILRSYQADVTIGIQDKADCFVIGELDEENDGRSIMLARASNILTYHEDEFFGYYDIDRDLAANTF